MRVVSMLLTTSHGGAGSDRSGRGAGSRRGKWAFGPVSDALRSSTTASTAINAMLAAAATTMAIHIRRVMRRSGPGSSSYHLVFPRSTDGHHHARDDREGDRHRELGG